MRFSSCQAWATQPDPRYAWFSKGIDQMNLSRVLAASATLLMAICVMPKAAPHVDTTPTEPVGCVSTDGGNSCAGKFDTAGTIVPDVSYPECWSEGQDAGPCYWDARTKGNGSGISYFLEADGTVKLLSFS